MDGQTDVKTVYPTTNENNKNALIRKYFGTQGHLTAKPAVRSSWNLNSTEIYPVLVASKSEEDMTENEHHFLHHLRACNSKMIDQIWL